MAIFPTITQQELESVGVVGLPDTPSMTARAMSRACSARSMVSNPAPSVQISKTAWSHWASIRAAERPVSRMPASRSSTPRSSWTVENTR